MTCPSCQNQARLLPCPYCGPLLEARRKMMIRRLMAYTLRGYVTGGLVPAEDKGAGPWESLDAETQAKWRAFAAQVLHSADELRAMSFDGKTTDEATLAPLFVWTGNAEAFAAELAEKLTEPELAAVSGEVAVVWMKKRSEEKTDGRADGSRD